MNLNSSSSQIYCGGTSRGIFMKLYRSTDKSFSYHMNGITWSENKNIYFEFAFEIDHCNLQQFAENQ